MRWRIIALVCLSLSLTSAGDEVSRPEVTLSHGGVLRGITNDFADKQVDVYLGELNYTTTTFLCHVHTNWILPYIASLTHEWPVLSDLRAPFGLKSNVTLK